MKAVYDAVTACLRGDAQPEIDFDAFDHEELIQARSYVFGAWGTACHYGCGSHSEKSLEALYERFLGECVVRVGRSLSTAIDISGGRDVSADAS